MFRRRVFHLQLPSQKLLLGERTLLMGVLNVTPDSFSDGGLFLAPEAAIERALELERAGADILDIGGESTRPGSQGISEEEEVRRVLPVIRRLRGRLGIPISIDSSKARVAEAAIEEGAEMLNDVTGLRTGPRLAEIARRNKVPIILMHMRGNPRTMQKRPFARDILRDVIRGLGKSLEIARRAGVHKSQIILDPGIGFGKSTTQNYELLAGLPNLARLGFPLLVGPSRKSFLASPAGTMGESARIWGTAAAVAASILEGAHIVRVHDVSEMAIVARVADAVLRPKTADPSKSARESRR